MDKKKVFSWALYDWANSAFSTTIMAGFFPVFFKTYWSDGADPVLTTARLGTAISFSSLLIALLSPTLGAMADLRGYKKRFCFLFMLIGVSASMSMALVPQGAWFLAIIVYGLAMMSFNATSVFYDALLPSIAHGKDMDRASSLGFALGYLGGGVLFLINVAMYLKPDLFGIASGLEAVQWSFVSVGLWWFVFSIPLGLYVPEPPVPRNSDSLFRLTEKSVKRLFATLKELLKQKNIALFLLAYWLYIDGVYTVMTMAVDYGMNVGLQSQDLIAALLVTQFVGFPATLAYGYLSQKWGCRIPILTCIAIYGVAVTLATWMAEAWHFYALAAVIGFVQGGVQSLSRSLFGRMIPAEKSAELFGLFNLVGKFASIAGPLVVAVGVTVTQNPRFGMMGLLVLFILGALLLLQVREPEHAPGPSAQQ